MPNKMLIDSSHPEETRVVVTRGNRIEEFDFESQDKKQLKGNIYLARVTRVEPSLQAAFVEYGGNRHGFLAFSEIHPDYYQIPVADRQAILRDEAEQVRAEDENGDEEDTRQSRSRGRRSRRSSKSSEGSGDNGGAEDGNTSIAAESADDGVISESAPDHGDGANGHDDETEVDTVGSEDAIDEAQTRRRPVRRNYKIQEVIKRRQILLVQVVKEERGNKGAAITTYLSLAGRYSVLMPNTARGGGISRKITSLQDRKRLKDIVRELEVPDGMGVILRTAGANRTRAEVKRDYEYLMRMWEKVRSLTLQSTAPALVYEEGSLIKRSIRDLYNKDIGEVLVAGEEGYREAKDFMRLLMPSHAKAVQPYRDVVPIFARNGIEGQLDKMLQPHVTLKSGGYIIINQTEALVAIDVNSGRSTKEHSIEDTALQTNLEAADEVARQLRLRDLAGLIVIDFIDMEENRNNRAVEKRLKDCLKNDRARIQVGRISHFGLLEMSRQRIRASVLESTMQPCPLCGGNGHVRSESSVALLVVRAIEEYLLKDWHNDLTVRTPSSTALYVLNHKRANLVALEQRFGVSIDIEADDTVGSQYYVFVKGPPAENPGTIGTAIVPETPLIEMDEDDAVDEPEEADVEDSSREPENDNADPGRDRKRRRRRKRRGGRDRSTDDNGHAEKAASDHDGDQSHGDESHADEASTHSGDDGGERKKRRRGKRGGKRNRRDETAAAEAAGGETDGQAHHDQQQNAPSEGDAAIAASSETAFETGDQESAPVAPEAVPTPPESDETASEKPKRKRAPRRKTAKADAAQNADETAAEPASPDEHVSASPEATEPESDGGDNVHPLRKSPEVEPQSERPSEPVVSSSEKEEEKKPRKAGWWQRKGFF